MYGNIVLASTKTGFVPNAIKWFTNSKFSHSLVTMPDILGVPMCIEAAEGGVDTAMFDKNYTDDPSQGFEVWSIRIDQTIKDKAIVSILADLEMGYGFLAYPFLIWRKICLIFGKDIKRQDNWSHAGMICSQLCVAYIISCGLQRVLVEYGNGSITPQDLQDIFVANPELFEKIQTIRL